MPYRHTIAATLLVLGSGISWAQPVVDISAKRHPNLAAAQQMSRSAWDKVVAAQKANEWDLSGHASKAKDLLDQVNKELKLAAEAANKDHK
ncbi:MAG TPA: hypothetical protein VGR76_18930 [Candidatus Angelobacter sp.]|jgi:hypothetical protein|nr:hypothetical protein [Candidatus Angelobacter sp.]